MHAGTAVVCCRNSEAVHMCCHVLPLTWDLGLVTVKIQVMELRPIDVLHTRTSRGTSISSDSESNALV